jgi:hypothetical protein
MKNYVFGCRVDDSNSRGLSTGERAVRPDLKKAEDDAKSSNIGNQGLSNDKIVAGLKQALTVSTGKAVALTGKPDGFLKNQAIKILLPEKLRTLGKGMRLMGMRAQMDDLEVGMNRAAEQATPKAKQIFLDAVTHMSFDDAGKILSGSDTAAAEYFKKQSSGELTTAFLPLFTTPWRMSASFASTTR